MPRFPIIAGADFRAARKEPNATWFALGQLEDNNLTITSLENTGSLALSDALSQSKQNAPVLVGLDFPFSYPLPFIEFIFASLPDFAHSYSLETLTWLELARKITSLDFESEFSLLASAFSRQRKASRLHSVKSRAPNHANRVLSPGASLLKAGSIQTAGRSHKL